MRKILGLFIIIGAMAAGSLPARAESFEYKDAEGDATGFYVVEETPRPSDDNLDITKVAVSSDGKTLTYAASIKKLTAEDPEYSTGYYFRLGFTFDGGTYWFLVGNSTLEGTTTNTFQNSETPATTIACKDCKSVMDVKKSAVIVTAPIAQLAAGIKAFRKDAAPFEKGAKLEALEVTAQRVIVKLTMTADVAVAPENTSVTL